MQAKLVVVGGKKAGQVIPLKPGKFFIGRAEDCQLRLGSDQVNRHHCAILIEPNLLAVRDFETKTGTFVNGERIGVEREIVDGDRLKVGPLEFVVQVSQADASTKKPAATAPDKTNAVDNAPGETDQESDAAEQKATAGTHPAKGPPPLPEQAEGESAKGEPEQDESAQDEGETSTPRKAGLIGKLKLSRRVVMIAGGSVAALVLVALGGIYFMGGSSDAGPGPVTPPPPVTPTAADTPTVEPEPSPAEESVPLAEPSEEMESAPDPPTAQPEPVAEPDPAAAPDAGASPDPASAPVTETPGEPLTAMQPDGFAPVLGPDPIAAKGQGVDHTETNVPPTTAPAEPPVPAYPPAVAEPTAQTPDRRSQMLDELVQQQIALFRQWKPEYDKLQTDTKELENKTVQWNQLDQQRQHNLLLAQQLQAEYEALRQQLQTPVIKAPKLEQGMLQCKQNLTAIAGELEAVQSDGDRLTKGIEKAKPVVAELQAKIDELTVNGLSLCDPFGRSDPACHRRVITLADGWLGEEPDLPLAHMVAAVAYARVGDFDAAHDELGIAGRLDPRLAPLSTAVDGYVFARQKNFRQAYSRLADAIKAESSSGLIYAFRAQSFVEEKKYSTAEKEFRKALEHSDDSAMLYEQTALLLAASPHSSVLNPKKALEHATRACELTEWQRWSPIDALAVAHAAAGDFQSAVEFAQKALELAGPEDQPGIRQRMALYQTNTPYRLE